MSFRALFRYILPITIFFAASVTKAQTIVQHWGAQCSAVNTLTCGVVLGPPNVTTGNAIEVSVLWYPAAAIATVSDNNGNKYSSAAYVTATTNFGDMNLAIFYACNVVATHNARR